MQAPASDDWYVVEQAGLSAGNANPSDGPALVTEAADSAIRRPVSAGYSRARTGQST